MAPSSESLPLLPAPPGSLGKPATSDVFLRTRLSRLMAALTPADSRVLPAFSFLAQPETVVDGTQRTLP